MTEIMTKKPSFADIAAMGTNAMASSPQASAPTPAEAVKAEKVPSQQQQTESDKLTETQPLQNKASSETASSEQSSAPATEEKTEKTNQPKENASRPRSDSTPTPAESSQRKQQEKSKSRRSRGKGRHGGFKHNGKEKKGSWKKLDVDINFNKDQSQPNSGTTDTENRKNGAASNKGSSARTASVKSRGENSKKGGRGNNARGGRNRVNRKTGELPEASKNWRDKAKNFKNSSYYQMCQPPSPEMIEQMKVEAVKQIEYFFSTEELVKNVFLRRHMDVEGYLPAAIVFNFPSVAGFGLSYEDLLSAVTKKSDQLDVDPDNECLRLREGHEKWLFPNDDGTFGCPKWLKQAVEEDETINDKDSSKRDENQGSDSKVEVSAERKEDPKCSGKDSSSTEEGKKVVESGGDDSKLKEASSPPDLTMTDSDTDHDSR